MSNKRVLFEPERQKFFELSRGYLSLENAGPLRGQVMLAGAKNAVLVMIASLILTEGKSVVRNVPANSDVFQMINLLRELGAEITFDAESKIMEVDTTLICEFKVKLETVNTMRASILVMGPLLARFGKAMVARPGGCLLGARPLDFHIRGFEKLGVHVESDGVFYTATTKADSSTLAETKVIFEYPSVGATENVLMYACLRQGVTKIVNAALEPEVLDLVEALKKMGAKISFQLPQTICIEGVNKLMPIDHEVIPDRLEAGSLLIAVAATGGELYLPNARVDHLELFLEKLCEMGHSIVEHNGIHLKATTMPTAVSFKTGPFPGFPTDLQAPMMALQAVAKGTSVIEETVFENRLMQVKELQKMGAQITVEGNSKAIVRGVSELYGCEVIAPDIRASCALVVAGLVARGQTTMTGLHHWKRGYDKLDHKLRSLGAEILLVEERQDIE